MAGLFWGGLGAAGQGFYQGQTERLERERLQQLIAQQQMQMDQQQAIPQGADALAQTMASLQSPPPQAQIPQTPNPGQASQPMQPQPMQPPQQPPPMPQQGGQPMPQGMPGVMPPPGAGGPQGGPQGPRPPQMGMQPIRPYTAPQAPQPMPQGMAGLASVPTNPVSRAIDAVRPDAFAISRELDKQGVKGWPKYYAMQQWEGLMSAEGKRQMAELSMALREQEASIRSSNADTAALRAQVAEMEAQRRERVADGDTPQAQANLALTKARTDQAEHAARAPYRAAGGSGGAGKVGKPVVFTGSDGKLYTRLVTPDGKIIVRDKDGKQAENVRAEGPRGQETMRKTVELDISEIDYALENMSEKGTASFFFADKDDKGAITRWRDNNLTPTEMQQYDVYANRVAAAIAGMQSMGRGQVSDAKIAAAKKLVPVPGDAEQTVKTKLAAIKKIRDNAEAINDGRKPGDDGVAGKSFSTEAEAEAAARSGKIKKGDKITIGGQSGTWQ